MRPDGRAVRDMPVRDVPGLGRLLRLAGRPDLLQGRWEALRGGRSNRLWRVDRPEGPVVCKLYPAEARENPLYPNLPRTEHAMLATLTGQTLAPEPLAFAQADGDGAALLIYRYLPGRPWTAGRDDPAEAARLLQRVHALGPACGLRHLPTGAADLTRQIAAIVKSAGSAAPALPPLDLPGDIPPAPRPALLHTDPVPGNLIVGPSGLRLIDWQCPALGDPVEDMAAFLSPAMQQLYGGHPLREDEERAFLAAWPDRATVRRLSALRPLFHARMAAYCAWRVSRGDRDYAAGVRLELSALDKSHRAHDQS